MFVGQRIADRYELRREIGRGAMGRVFFAEDTRLRRPVAVKLIAPTQDDVAFRRAYAMFAAEARVSAMMTHANIVTVYDFIDDDASPALVMELVEGETLAARLARGERWTLDGAAQLLAQVCDGLAVAHAAGLVHRDLKPANLMLPMAGGVKILDFGIAHSDEGTGDGGVILGTPNYMSPEQVRGGSIDARSDLWALGAIGFEMTTQVRPFQGDNATAVIFEVLNTEPVWSLLSPSGTPYENILRRALTRDVQLRWGTVTELAGAFRSSVAMALPFPGYVPVSGSQASTSGAWPAPTSLVPPSVAPGRNFAPLLAGIVTTIVLGVCISIYSKESVTSGGGGGGGGGDSVMITSDSQSSGVDTISDAAGSTMSVKPPSESLAMNDEDLVRRRQDETVRRSVARLLDDGAYEDAWDVLSKNNGIASADVLFELRQRVRRACDADNEDLRGRGQPSVACP